MSTLEIVAQLKAHGFFVIELPSFTFGNEYENRTIVARFLHPKHGSVGFVFANRALKRTLKDDFFMTTRYEDLPHVGICTSSPGQRIGRTFDIADPKEILRYCGTPRVRDDTRRTALRIPAVTVRVVLCSLLVSLPFISDETNRHTPP